MSRPSRHTDVLLIAEARKMLPKAGCTGLNIREVAAGAGVNLGMFHYHFKSKDEFTRRVLETVYEEFFSEFNIEATQGKMPIECLASALNVLGRFSRDNRALIVSLLRDVLNGDQEVVRFMKTHFVRHFGILLRIVKECQKTGAIEKAPLPLLLPHLLGCIGGPSLIFEILERVSARKPFGLALSVIRSKMLSDAAIAKRVDVALKGWGK